MREDLELCVEQIYCSRMSSEVFIWRARVIGWPYTTSLPAYTVWETFLRESSTNLRLIIGMFRMLMVRHSNMQTLGKDRFTTKKGSKIKLN